MSLLPLYVGAGVLPGSLLPAGSEHGALQIPEDFIPYLELEVLVPPLVG